MALQALFLLTVLCSEFVYASPISAAMNRATGRGSLNNRSHNSTCPADTTPCSNGSAIIYCHEVELLQCCVSGTGSECIEFSYGWGCSGDTVPAIPNPAATSLVSSCTPSTSELSQTSSAIDISSTSQPPIVSQTPTYSPTSTRSQKSTSYQSSSSSSSQISSRAPPPTYVQTQVSATSEMPTLSEVITSPVTITSTTYETITILSTIVTPVTITPSPDQTLTSLSTFASPVTITTAIPVTTIQNSAPQGSISENSNVIVNKGLSESDKIALGLGLGVGVFTVISTVIAFVMCCR